MAAETDAPAPIEVWALDKHRACQRSVQVFGIQSEKVRGGDQAVHLLYVSTSPLFSDGATVVSRLEDVDDYPVSWRRSIQAIRATENHGAKRESETIVVSVAVRIVSDAVDISPFSNSIDVTVHRAET
jgi:hypothetical protein